MCILSLFIIIISFSLRGAIGDIHCETFGDGTRFIDSRDLLRIQS